MTINVRTLILIVLVLSSFSVLFQNVRAQLVIFALTLFLLFFTSSFYRNKYRILHRLGRLIPVILSVSLLQTVFRQTGDELFRIFFISITYDGIINSLIVSLRLVNILLIAVILLKVPYYDFILALSKWKIPYEISFMIASSINFVSIFSKIFDQARETLLVRGIDISSLPVLTRLKAYNTIVFPVLASALHNIKYRAIYLEMRSFRLYNTRTFLYNSKLSRLDKLIQSTIFLTLIIYVLLTFFLK